MHANETHVSERVCVRLACLAQHMRVSLPLLLPPPSSQPHLSRPLSLSRSLLLSLSTGFRNGNVLSLARAHSLARLLLLAPVDTCFNNTAAAVTTTNLISNIYSLKAACACVCARACACVCVQFRGEQGRPHPYLLQHDFECKIHQKITVFRYRARA